MAWDVNRYFTEESTNRANMHINNILNLINYGEIQIKIKMNFKTAMILV